MLAIVAILPVLSTLPPVRIFLAGGRFWLAIPEPPPCLKGLLSEILLEALDSLRVWLEGGDVGV